MVQITAAPTQVAANIFWTILSNAFLTFGLALIQVSVSTLRTIVVTRGKHTWAAGLGFVEVSLWLTAVNQVIGDLNTDWNVVGYSLGYAVGTMLGMGIERWLAMGHVNIQIVSLAKGLEITQKVRQAGYGATQLPAQGRIVAIAGAIVRDHLWYLSAFWTRPELQRQGIGMPLLKAVRTAGQEAGATVFFTWSSVDSAAMASYMKLGMLPGYPVLLFEGTPQKLLSVASAYEVAPFEKSQAMALDQEIRGTHRSVDHDFLTIGACKDGR